MGGRDSAVSGQGGQGSGSHAGTLLPSQPASGPGGQEHQGNEPRFRKWEETAHYTRGDPAAWRPAG